MSKSEKIKEQIGWLKVSFAIFMAIDISLIGWLASSCDQDGVSMLKVYASVGAIAIVSAVVVLINKRAFKKIDELEEL
ncbi:MAG: hypothetical protein ACLFQJ_05130 [Campylobacterales bacterium]